MSKIEGIKSVDFKIKASGYGVVNWNGTTTFYSRDKEKEWNNHSLPKLRGFTNKMTKDEKLYQNKHNYKYIEDIGDINFKETPLYISQNCIRYHLFKDQANDLRSFYNNKDNKNYSEKKMIEFLASNAALVRGFVIPGKQYKKTSALLITDFVDESGNGNFEQFANSGKKDANSIYSKITFGETKYTAIGSISIEQLQFISLDDKFDRACMIIKEFSGDEVAKKVEDFIKSLDSSKDPKVTFHKNYVRQGTIFADGEEGLLLDDVACDILVQETLNRLENLTIKQAKGYMMVDKVVVDYNSSNKMLRIKENTSEVSSLKNSNNYAIYFAGKD